jgi:DNA primase
LHKPNRTTALSFATPSNNDLLLNFEKTQQSITDLKALGLVKTGEYGDYDFFRDRLMFPGFCKKPC